jgi:hypothetical protein
MRFVPIKTDQQLDLQSLHRVRERRVMRRTEASNQTRRLLLERGITLRKGRCHLEAALPGIIEDATTGLVFLAECVGDFTSNEKIMPGTILLWPGSASLRRPFGAQEDMVASRPAQRLI